MEKISFISKVNAFCNIHCSEYMSSQNVTFDLDDPDDLRAVIELEDDYGFNWEVPIKVSHYEKDEIGIDIGDAGTLAADGSGLYCYLWHLAVDWRRDMSRLCAAR